MANVTSTLTSIPSPTSFLSSLSLPSSLETTLSSLLASPLFAKASGASWKTYAVSVGVVYLALCQALRFQREKSMRRRYGFPDRASLRKMTVEDAQKIIKELASLEFPQMSETSLQFGLFKTYGVETISRLLLGTRNLTDPVASRKRYEDTGIIIGEFMANPPNSARATTSVARMNWLHSKYIQSGQISNADLLYTLSVFITEPVRFARLYDWRPLNDMEHCAYGVFWKSIGDAMGIQYEGFLAKTEWADGLDFALDVAQWAKAYEVVAFKPSPISNKPAVALIPMITYWVPRWAQSFTQECVHVLLGDRVREAFLLPEPGIAAATFIYSSLWLRRLFLRHLSLPRVVRLKRHQEDTDAVDRPLHINWSYGNYPFYIKPTLWNRWGPGAWAVWLAGGKLPGEEPEEHLPKGFTFTDLGPLNRMGQGAEEMKKDFERMQAKGMGGCPFG
ncbi:hypothetical protein JX266_008367 [Neoarthrinium moseri]|uniref:uncharacterized protein n=1 Tax=Neoarthrinium moseri TaxID=1658444 RepID=UPI001FDE9405|nr:uncharacterized protein JN550_011931 [Neoarthrinium moseri]KAI1845509.1 hypothetical protein JX266_008367 [Neoarthrinium moseri]KAI1859623.1 hypothetical protein JN550_011931 [Neoarthrinium moseri]